jgi:cytochrome P450
LERYDTNTRDDLIARLYNEQCRLAEKKLQIPFHVSEEGIVEETTNLLFAGTDTTGNTLTYLFWQLSHSPIWLKRVRDEAKGAFGDQKNPPYSAISELPVLDAVIHELWRVWPAGAGSLERLTQKEGALIDGVVVPANVRSSPHLF